MNAVPDISDAEIGQQVREAAALSGSTLADMQTLFTLGFRAVRAASAVNAETSHVILRDLTDDEKPLGDWKITIQKLSPKSQTRRQRK